MTVLYDAECPLCTHLRDWLVKQRQLVPLDLVPAGHSRARELFPGLDHAATLSDITVIADGGQVYRGPAAWIACMWALRDHRATAHRMATPAGMRIAKRVVLTAAKYRTARWEEQAWGGAPYRRQDGWTYDREDGWHYEGPRDEPAACDSDCRPAD
ncbi:thiol-disulfide oxidoreductase DCC family protein [Streptomyces citrinus]|uniref:thiol-disulfide oxidoreductase DCC family protein n=1 Tax=Streptomyces citrinus TaxID=3118173 RepID=UPI003CC59B06